MDPYLGEVRLFGGAFAPPGWAACNGQLMSIQQNPALFAVLGAAYGGDGVTTFALPDLRGRIPLHQGTNPLTGSAFPLGARGGTETVVLTTEMLPAHTHRAQASPTPGTKSSPQNSVWGSSALNQYSGSPPTAAMGSQAIQPSGRTEPHTNLMPSLTLTFMIALEGLNPVQS